ncbi:hypothetical protein ACFXDJ_35790 [Streptomyces sp. NPDC059443]|uniref:hypothetical protein n=1 Tax=unclassified Streptomyces TaxID=2593676 RepID=UPI0036965739
MGNTRAFPVLRTKDLPKALAAARGLLRLADLSNTTVNVYGQAGSQEQLLRMVAALPAEACIRSADEKGPIAWYTAEEIPGIPAEDYPMEVSVEDQPLGAMDESALLETVNTGLPGSLEWWDTPWPEVPELGLLREMKYADVQISVYCRGLFRDEPSPDHTVHVHIRGNGDARVEWLAEQVGLSVIGPSRHGW